MTTGGQNGQGLTAAKVRGRGMWPEDTSVAERLIQVRGVVKSQGFQTQDNSQRIASHLILPTQSLLWEMAVN